MKILFLTMVRITTLKKRGIYQDLLNYFVDEGHKVFIVSPIERRYGKPTSLADDGNIKILNIKTLNVKKTNVIEKGFGQVLLEWQYLKAIKKYFKDEDFDLLLYSTPPVTFNNVIKFIKSRNKVYTYLLLKDIFPQNAVDMGMMLENGLYYNYFKKKEKMLYDLSDTIGCMSEANKRYILKHNPEIEGNKVEVNPNTITPKTVSYTKDEVERIRSKYGLPSDKKIFVYGGNLGIPQGIDFLIKVLENVRNEKAYFLVVGDGTQFGKLKKWFDINNPENATLIKRLPKEEYDKLLGTCDAGLIFLDKRFTIPNFPSRLLSYLEMKIPVITATDKYTDIGTVVEKAGCGYAVLSGDIQGMQDTIDKLIDEEEFDTMGEKAWDLLINNYRVERSYNLINEKVIAQ